ncbi:hypothetical protein GQ55_2G383400 [Panicum hallii var. hallii]|uniref:Uncharacterized protein n=1 Tax=Panicum hallii var. hallii TaxID=1504633 RepID=A0A2T7EWV8_9POAL|nr:hypothetical protein GQ55_2G383400 [Panicum hallii var. hallii]
MVDLIRVGLGSVSHQIRETASIAVTAGQSLSPWPPIEMPITFSFSVCPAPAQSSRPSVQLREAEESPAARRELQLLEDHRPWEMLDNMALAIIDQTYAALLEILGHAVPPPEEGDGGHVTVSHLFDAADTGSPPEPPPALRVEASARHCRIYVVTAGREFARHAFRRQRSWPPRHRLNRASVSASLGALCLARADGGGRGDYWKCADDDVRPDVSGRGLLGVLDAIRARLDAAVRLEGRLLEIARAHRCRGDKVREILRVRTALEDMRREVDLGVIARRRRFQKRPRVVLITYRPEADMDVDREEEAEEVTKRLKALHV